jgi:hypothetical protein
MRAHAALVALCAAVGSARADAPDPDAPGAPPAPPQGQGSAAPPAEPAPEPSPPADSSRDLKDRLNREVERSDPEPGAGSRSASRQTTERPTGLFFGASVAYAASAKVAVSSANMNGTVSFPAVYSAELQAGYRLLPYLSVALASEMMFNLRPNQLSPANELCVFAQATAHVAATDQWDLDLFAAPGYGELFLPGAPDARGLMFRWGGGPVYRSSEHLNIVGVLSHQLGFERVHGGSDAAMKTTFVSVIIGIRLIY